jgi:hypothetical protein
LKSNRNYTVKYSLRRYLIMWLRVRFIYSHTYQCLVKQAKFCLVGAARGYF